VSSLVAEPSALLFWHRRGIQEVASSILVSSTTEKALFPLILSLA